MAFGQNQLAYQGTIRLRTRTGDARRGQEHRHASAVGHAHSQQARYRKRQRLMVRCGIHRAAGAAGVLWVKEEEARQSSLWVLRGDDATRVVTSS